ncbi:ABC transporter permease [Anaerofilum sp. BX8]|uniref:ABC transporter permease n=1 Tax=Anaerofilum hominis TaxID=2763016 RepID=A0A923I7B7_9FIRM|nr:ABC transporter permease [Anaerofilum hominis]MBC5580469.1 ABC transporter permease [Anaerofilum hominis]
MSNKILQAKKPAGLRHYKGYWLTRLVDFFPVLGFLAIIVFFGLATGGKMFTWFNIKTIWKQSFLYIVGGLGVIFCYAQGVHDFSLASNIALSAILGTKIGGDNAFLTVLIALGVGTAVGAVNGFIYSRTGVGDFILTLCMNFLISGTLITLMGNVAYQPGSKGLIALNSGIFEAIVIFAVTLIVTFVFNFTKYGRYCKVLSAGPTAASQCGVNVKGMKFMAFLVAGFTAGVIAVLSVIRTGTAGSGTGAMFHFNIMICMILGGMPLSGGRDAKIINVFFGVLGCMALTNGMVMLGLSSRAQDVVKGIVFIVVAVGMTRLRDKANAI